MKETARQVVTARRGQMRYAQLAGDQGRQESAVQQVDRVNEVRPELLGEPPDLEECVPAHRRLLFLADLLRAMPKVRANPMQPEAFGLRGRTHVRGVRGVRRPLAASGWPVLS